MIIKLQLLNDDGTQTGLSYEKSVPTHFIGVATLGKLWDILESDSQ